MIKTYSTLAVVFLVALVGSLVHAQEPSVSEAELMQRYAALCKVWGTVRYQHPYLAYKDIDWDSALIKTLPNVEAAKTSDEFAAAVQSMLDVLQDPVTRVVNASGLANVPTFPLEGNKPAAEKWFTQLEDGVLTIDVSSIPDANRLRGPIPQLTELRDEITKAQGLIFDCRRVWLISPAVQESVLQLACAKEVRSIGQRHVVHSGYVTQTGISSGDYYSAWETEFATSFTPRSDHHPPKSVWLVSEQFTVPEIALALQQIGEALIVVQGHALQDLVVRQSRLPLADGYEVWMRMSERITPENNVYTFQADAEVAADADFGFDGPAYKSGLALLKNPQLSKRGDAGGAAQPLPTAVFRQDKSYSDMRYPDREYRLLGLFRFWNVIHYFYPYKHLLDRTTDSALISCRAATC